VIARNSSFAYKGRAVDVKQVGRELGVRYVLEGSVRKATNRVRITGQLVDATTGAHLWADRFDGGLDDIFDLQDRITASVAGAITPKLDLAEIERAKRKPTESLDAYDYHLRAMASYYQPTRSASEEALRLFYKSIELDPDFASSCTSMPRRLLHGGIVCPSASASGSFTRYRSQDAGEPQHTPTARARRTYGAMQSPLGGVSVPV
jgi:hypothetical protein